MAYKKLFDPKPPQPAARGTSRGDRAPGATYKFTAERVLDVNVALATGRPLLVRGPSGSGKSSLAVAVAQQMGRILHRITVTSRTQSEDLLWEVDLVRRLHDAHTDKLGDEMADYVRPGVLWQAFAPRSATEQENRFRARAGMETLPLPDSAQAGVVLLDEIDKADPDVPNNLLVPLGNLEFLVEPTGFSVTAAVAPMVVVTTNEERELPPAFLRRCIETRIRAFDADDLIEIAQLHLPNVANSLAKRAAELAGETGASVAEFLDLVRAGHELNLEVTDADWQAVERAVLAGRLDAEAEA